MRAFFVLFRVNKNIYEIAGFLFIDRRPREMGPDSVRPYNSRNCVACGPFARGAARIKLGTIASMCRAGARCHIPLVDGVTGCASGMRVHCVCTTETLVTVVFGSQQTFPTEALEQAWL